MQRPDRDIIRREVLTQAENLAARKSSKALKKGRASPNSAFSFFRRSLFRLKFYVQLVSLRFFNARWT